jgi:hypothetical protein
MDLLCIRAIFLTCFSISIQINQAQNLHKIDTLVLQQLYFFKKHLIVISNNVLYDLNFHEFKTHIASTLRRTYSGAIGVVISLFTQI